jgi:hypothetical protein
MRRLLTGYAVCFNKGHGHSGHLFQNRYKSIVCEEDNYLLELIRYIHLNPLRAGLVKDLNTLSRYAWCGHSVLMGKHSLVGQNVSEVLALFGKTPAAAQQAYLAFVEEGVALGRRPESSSSQGTRCFLLPCRPFAEFQRSGMRQSSGYWTSGGKPCGEAWREPRRCVPGTIKRYSRHHVKQLYNVP